MRDNISHNYYSHLSKLHDFASFHDIFGRDTPDKSHPCNQGIYIDQEHFDIIDTEPVLQENGGLRRKIDSYCGFRHSFLSDTKINGRFDIIFLFNQKLEIF